MNFEAMEIDNPPDLEREFKPLQCVQTLQRLEALTSRLLCVKCNDVPRGKVFGLGCCYHKYCEKCVKGHAGKECVVCGERGFPKDVKPDLFSTNLLKEIPKVYRVLKGLQEMGCHRNEGEEDPLLSPPQLITQTQRRNKSDERKKEAVVADEMEMEVDVNEVPMSTSKAANPRTATTKENEPAATRKILNKKNVNSDPKPKVPSQVNDYDVFEFQDCTPVGSGQNGPPSPDVLEETPQHKPKPRMSLALSARRKTDKIKEVRHLDFPEEEKSDKKKASETTANKNENQAKKVEIEAGFASDEELFRSQQSDQGLNGGGGVPCELPVLTPHPSVSASKQKSKTGKKQSVAKQSSTSGSDRDSREHQLPALTPYGNPEDKKVKSSEPKATVETKRPARGRGRQLFKAENGSSGSSTKTTKSKTPKEASRKAKTPAATEPTKRDVPVRKRRHSTGVYEINYADVDDDDDDDEDFKVYKKSAKSSVGRPRSRRASAASNASSTAAVRKVALPSPSPAGSLNDSFVGVGVKSGKEKRNAKGETGLHVACRAGQLDKVQSLLDAGSDVEVKDYAGWTSLHETVNSKKSSIETKVDLIRLLHKHNCNINAVGGPDQETALHSAAFAGLEKVVEVLLELGASPNIRNDSGQLPKDVSFNDVIINMLNEKAGTAGRKSASGSSTAVSSDTGSLKSNLESTILTTPEDDPAVLQVMIAKAVLFFNFKISKDKVEQTQLKLGLRTTDDLMMGNVTHIIHKVEKKNGLMVPMSMEYLYGLAKGMWQVSSEWIEKSLRDSKCLSPTPFEIIGYEGCNDSETFRVPIMCRANHEKGNPGLFDGFTFFLFRTCGYVKRSTDLTKEDLIILIKASGGKITNREPNPNDIDPLDGPQRFHAIKGADPTNPSKFALTTHIILYDDKISPPQTKMYRMEHVKTLKSDWLIESLANFRLEDPETFY